MIGSASQIASGFVERFGVDDHRQAGPVLQALENASRTLPPASN
jgi:hypothetical protein